MAPAFSKEAILQGNIDHLCLVCESYLKTERDVCLHISTSEHKQNLDDTDYVDEYKNDRIRKVKKWYYCEFCNVLVSTTIHVRLHVAESRHNENKKSQMTARVDDVILFGDSAITEESWHGFINDNTCIICNVEFENMENHKKESSHIINLIQSTVCNYLHHPYRKIDDSTFHCLMCNAVVSEITVHLKEHKHINIVQNRGNINPLTLKAGCNKENDIKKCSSQSTSDIDNIGDNNGSKANASDISDVTKVCDDITVEGKVELKEIEEHIICDSDSHASRIMRDCTIDSVEMKNHLDGSHHENMLEAQEDFAQKSNSDAVKNNKNMSDIVESIKEFNNESIDINLEIRTAVCSRCSVNLEFDYEVINNHIKDHKNDIRGKEKAATLLSTNDEYKATYSDADNQTKQNGGDVIQQMVDQHDLTYDGTKLYCKKCNKLIPKSVRNINEHVKGVLHRSKASLTGTSTNFQSNENKKVKEKKCNLKKIPMCKFVTMMTLIKNTHEVIINDKYCFDFLALICVTVTKSHGQLLRCHVCEVNVNRQNLQNHINTPTHERAMNEVPIITNMESEFIREIRSDTFQCGFCNIIDSWEGMENHLKSTAHKDRKNFANWRLLQVLTEMRQIQRDQIHHEFLMNLISRTLDISYLHDLFSN